ncbi:four helix bundle protein [Patescibacteria group bacterium]|nr:four helix bundle protein [Patescibacteria group bacterium]
MGEIKTFSDLNAWKEAHKLVLLIYKTTNEFPNKETCALTGQMRRAVVSVSSNLAEGFSRRGNKEKIRFYAMALGSLTELQNQTMVAKDVGYINAKAFSEVENQTVIVHKLVNGLIKGVAKLHNT